MSRILSLFVFLAIMCGAIQAQQNAPQQLNKPYVILISLDGFRYDYVERFQPPNLTQFIQAGVAAESMVPSYPSKTFPNHYTIATGMRPENHGLVANTFIDPERGESYKIGKREAVEDGTWYRGTPLWVNAEKNGMVSASYFFVGSEADIQGVRPSYYYPYKHTTPNTERVQQALDWLKLPADQRPHLITMYFSTMDDTGHRVGPQADEELRAALLELDTELGQLFKGVKNIGLPVNIILVSDHGMQQVPVDRMIPEEILENEQMYELANNGAFALVYVRDGVRKKKAFRYLKKREDHFKVYRTKDFPYYSENRSNRRLGDLIVLPDFPYYFKSIRNIGFARKSRNVRGEHGFPPEQQAMHAIFYAQGPAFKTGIKIPAFDNIHVYPLVCHMLGLPIPPYIDGQLSVLAPVLNETIELKSK